jgi:hypothetical protein
LFDKFECAVSVDGKYEEVFRKFCFLFVFHHSCYFIVFIAAS